MSTPTENMLALTESCNQLYDVVDNKVDEIDTAVQTAVDDFNTAKANIVADETATAQSRQNVEDDETAVAASKTNVDNDAAAIATAIADINDAINPKLPVYNMLRDGGRFTTLTNPHSITYTAAFTSTFSGFGSYNGCVIADGGKFTNNNSTHGGTQAAIPQTIDDLFTAMGTPGRRYGAEFHIAKCTAGTGTSATAVENHYLMFNAVGGAVVGPTNKAAISFWVRVTAGTAWLAEASRHAIDGALVVGDKELLIADGWQHVSATGGSSIGYISSSLPNIFGVDGTVVEIALPIMLPADVLLPVHTHPVPTLRT